jgi:thiazole synthase ThiGH ThiG subunit
MGMSSDMAQAIAAGSTMVRVGTAIFGARHYHAMTSAGRSLPGQQ